MDRRAVPATVLKALHDRRHATTSDSIVATVSFA
jgi:hypothetical protein